MDLHPVTGPCQCDTKPHEQDEAFLRPHLGLEAGLSAHKILVAIAQGEMERGYGEVQLGILYVTSGLVSWNWTNGTGEPIAINDENIRRNVPWSRMYALAEAAGELYGEEMFAPLLKTASRSSSSGPTTASTSRTKRSSGSRRKRS